MLIYLTSHLPGLGALVFREPLPTTVGLASLRDGSGFCSCSVLFPIASIELKSVSLTLCNDQLEVSRFYFSTVEKFPRAHLLPSILSKQNIPMDLLSNCVLH